MLGGPVPGHVTWVTTALCQKGMLCGNNSRPPWTNRPGGLARTASAIQVITQDDIRRPGAASLAEALRLAANLQVAQIDSRQWAISARGFNGTTANKLLVLIDGRTVYTPLFSGVFWDVQEVPLQDIDRIEVISGPGATLWGANAVNGVINVITKDAKDTQGFLLSGGGGTEQHGFGTVRYGAALGSSVRARIYGRGFDRDATALPGGQEAADDWHMGQGGFRMDWEASSARRVTLQGDLYDGRSEEHTSELQSPCNLVCRLLLEKKKKKKNENACEQKT